jgi:hypothetical protein
VRAHLLGKIAAVLALGGPLVACSTILGFDSVSLNGDDGGLDAATSDATTDSTTDSTTPSPDASGDVAHVDGASDASVDSSPCGDTMTSQQNCGRCGHDCFKGMCVSGVCQPFQLSFGWNGSWDLAVDDTNVYFTNLDGNTVYRVSKVDGSNPVKIADQPDALRPHSITVDGTYVYWTNYDNINGEVRRCPIAGCGSNPSTLLSAANYPGSIFVVGNRVFWAEDGAGTVTSADVTDGGNRKVLYAKDDAGTQPYQIAHDTNYVYFTDIGLNGFPQRIPFDGGAAVALNSNQLTNGIALGDAGIFFTGGGFTDGVLWRIKASDWAPGANAVSFASPLKHAYGVALDDNYVYWVNGGTQNLDDGSIMACPLNLATCTMPILLASNLHYPRSIAVDRDAVYWTNYGDTTSVTDSVIWKVAKP